MINLGSLTDSDIGRDVIYTDAVFKRQMGRIKSWNHLYVFVVYNCADNWDDYQDYTAAATEPCELEFAK